MRLFEFNPSRFVLFLLPVTAGITHSARVPRDLYDYPAVIATSDFLRRAYQASVVAGNWLYIDGGSFSFMASGSTQYQYASTLLSIDLSQNWTNTSVVFQSTLKPDGVPKLDGPSLWYHYEEDVLYTGFTGTNTSFGGARDLPPLSLWTFKPDGAGSGAWNEVINATSPTWDSLTRPRYPLQAHGSNSAWILGGNNLPSESPTPIGENMVHFDMESRTFGNSTVSCCNASNGIAGGAMQFVPSFGPQGIFVVMGGANGNALGGAHDLLGFTEVSVFDPAKQEWWNQTTTGNEPSPRMQFCTAGINSTNGTYEIFVYAGWDGVLGSRAVQYDTINVLTLPAFHWITVPYNPQNPRHGHSCNPVGGSQIISIGGVDSTAVVPTGQNIIRRTFDNSPDPFAQGLAIFDMTELTFVNQYNARAPPYVQSEDVKQFYTQSQGKYLQGLSPGVAALLQTTHFTSSSSSTSPNSFTTSPSSVLTAPRPSISSTHPSKRKLGGLYGGVFSGASVALLFALAAVMVILRKRRNSLQEARPGAVSEVTEKPDQANQAVQEMHEDIRPIELSGMTIQELNGQSLQEMEQPRPRIELYAHDFTEMQGSNQNL